MKNEMKHLCHKHVLILNEDYDSKEGDVCRGCNEKIVSCKSFVYSCSRSSSSKGSTSTNSSGEECAKFLLHKTCAELPETIENPTNPHEFLMLIPTPRLAFNINEKFRLKPDTCDCSICGLPWRWFTYFCYYRPFSVCLKCALFHVQSSEDRKLDHPAHNQHQLTLVQRPSSFKCDACKVEDYSKDLSYICTRCPFWMHKSCADAPTSFLFHFHYKHPLILSYSLPQLYHSFAQICRLCHKTLYHSTWLYYCPKCRFFAHFQCARSNRFMRSSEIEIYDYNLAHLPAVDESSISLLVEQFVKTSTLKRNNSIFSGTNGINHWDHKEHRLQLNTISDLKYQEEDEEILLLCDGCIKPIQNDGDLFYACVPCKYFLHKFCAELPEEIGHPIRKQEKLFTDKSSKPYEFFICNGCKVPCNGIYFRNDKYDGLVYIHIHIGCMMLPQMIKHEAHRHQLSQYYTLVGHDCKACGRSVVECLYRCKQCDFYTCGGCVMKTKTVKHRWDPHPLHLIYEADMVTDHEHEFDCEYCSKEIDTNGWFYHCSDCDLSFHLDCFERSCYRYYSNVKFGATDIVINKLHPHGLTLVLNKKVRRCDQCHKEQLGEPVLTCDAPCKAIFCTNCAIKSHR